MTGLAPVYLEWLSSMARALPLHHNSRAWANLLADMGMKEKPGLGQPHGEVVK